MRAVFHSLFHTVGKMEAVGPIDSITAAMLRAWH